MKMVFESLFFFAAASLTIGSSAAVSPANDSFTNAQLITLGQGSVEGSNLGATRENGEPMHAANPGGASIWWKINISESGYLTLSTLNSISTNGFGLDTLLAVYTGTSLASLTLVGTNDEDEETGSHGSKLLVKVTGGTQYYIAVDGYAFLDMFGPDQGQVVLEYSFSKTITYKAAPAWELPDIAGKTVKSSDFTNQVVVFNFWATWCPPCIEEIPDLIALQDKYRKLGLVVVGVSIDDPVENKLPLPLVGGFAQTHAMTYPVVMTRPGGLAVETDYGPIFAIPTTLIIDRKNNIVKRTIGSHKLSAFEAYVLPSLLDSFALRANRVDGKLKLEWSTVPLQVRAQYTDSLPTASWKPVSGSPVAGAETTSLSVDDNAANTTRFYRLEVVP